MKYRCHKCHAEFSRKNNFLYHLFQAKRPCESYTTKGVVNDYILSKFEYIEGYLKQCCELKDHENYQEVLVKTNIMKNLFKKLRVALDKYQAELKGYDELNDYYTELHTKYMNYVQWLYN